MNLFRLFAAARRDSAPVARDRLMVLLAHERALSGPLSGASDLVARLREEILTVIARHVPIERDKVQVKLDRGPQVSTLEIGIEVPSPEPARTHPRAGVAA